MPISPKFIGARPSFTNLQNDPISNNFREILWWAQRNSPWTIKVALTSGGQSQHSTSFIVGFNTQTFSSYSPPNPNAPSGHGLIWTPSAIGAIKYGTIQVPQYGAYQVTSCVGFISPNAAGYSGYIQLIQNATVVSTGSYAGVPAQANQFSQSNLADVVICNPGDTLAIQATVTGAVAPNQVSTQNNPGQTQWTIRFLGIL